MVTTKGGQFLGASPVSMDEARKAAVPALVDGGLPEADAIEQVKLLPAARIVVDAESAAALRAVVVACCGENTECGSALLDEMGGGPEVVIAAVSEA